MARQLLVLTGPVELEAKLVDVIDDHGDGTALLRAEVSVHRDEGVGLSNADQVMGRSRSIELRIAIDEEAVPPLLEALRRRLPARSVRFLILPILQQGEIE